jgi:hypothetical protein
LVGWSKVPQHSTNIYGRRSLDTHFCLATRTSSGVVGHRE